MRAFQSVVFTAILSMASLVAHAETLKVTVEKPLTTAGAHMGAQALRELPQSDDVYVSTRRRVYAVGVRDGQPIADSEVTELLAKIGQTVTSIKRTDDSFGYVKARLKRSPHRYFKWG